MNPTIHIEVAIHAFERHSGTISVFHARRTTDNTPLRVAVDRRLGYDIEDAIGRGLQPSALIEPWQVLP